MGITKARALVVCVVFAHCLVSNHRAQGGFVPLVTKDATQSSMNPTGDFEEVLAGDKRSLIMTDQFVNSLSPSTPPTVSFDPTTNTTIVHFEGPPISDSTTFHTFGYAINAVTNAVGGPIVNPMNKDGYWTPLPPPTPGHVPGQNVMAQYMPASHQALITISNDPQTFSLFSVGYLVTNVPFALTSLNRTTLPPGAFVPSGVPDGTTLTPGGIASFTISGINSGQYVTVFADAQFSGNSAGNPYKDLSGRWLEFQAVPEPASWVLMTIGTATLLGRLASRRGVRTTTPILVRMKS